MGINIEKINYYHWNWFGKMTPIGKLRNFELERIRNYVNNNPKVFYNLTAEEWSVNIKTLLDYRRVNKEINNQINNSKNFTHSKRG